MSLLVQNEYKYENICKDVSNIIYDMCLYMFKNNKNNFINAIKLFQKRKTIKSKVK